MFARKLIITDGTNITQIDPIDEYDEEDLRLIRAKELKDPVHSAKAKSDFNSVRDLIPSILKEKKSLFNHKKDTHLTPNEHIETVVDLFMNKDDHASIIKFEELKELNLNVVKMNDSKEVLSDFKELFNYSKEVLDRENKRLLMVTSSKLKDHDEKILISDT